MCDVQTQKKYTQRPSPAYPANKCCNETKVGNDGRVYKSVRNKAGICTWKIVNKEERSNFLEKEWMDSNEFSKVPYQKSKTVPELRKMLREKGVKKTSTFNKKQLEETLDMHDWLSVNDSSKRSPKRSPKRTMKCTNGVCKLR